MDQKVTPDDYKGHQLPDAFIEDAMQTYAEIPWLLAQTEGYNNIIDLGFGSGLVCRALGEAGKQVRMVDGSKTACKEARQYKGVDAVCSMFEAYEPTCTADVVIASFVLEHVADPVALLKRCAQWAPRLIAVIGNAESWHRRLAVAMGLQPRLDTLSARDEAVGHYCVYTRHSIAAQLAEAGWLINSMRGIMFKPLPNAMMANFDERLIRAMCEAAVEPRDAANIGLVCKRA